MTTSDRKRHWRGYLAGAQDANGRHGTGLGPDAGTGDGTYDAGYADGWTAETLRLGLERVTGPQPWCKR